MTQASTTPLAKGLVGGGTGPILGQLEVSLLDSRRLKVVIKRNPYSGQPDIEFSIPTMSLHDIIDILCAAQDKLDEQWLSRVATKELGVKRTAAEARAQA